MKEKRLCKIEDCNRSYCAKGFCSKHYQRNKFYGDAYYVNVDFRNRNREFKNIEEKFYNCIEIITETGCWIWLRSLNNSGYAIVNESRKIIPMHRWSYERFKGKIPENMCVCHSCDIRSCVNPNHLWLGSWQDNINDKVNKNRQAKGEKAPKAKLTSEMVLEIYKSKAPIKLLMKKYNMSKRSIVGIRHKESWKHILENI
jgi:HNH endonuclease